MASALEPNLYHVILRDTHELNIPPIGLQHGSELIQNSLDFFSHDGLPGCLKKTANRARQVVTPHARARQDFKSILHVNARIRDDLAFRLNGIHLEAFYLGEVLGQPIPPGHASALQDRKIAYPVEIAVVNGG